MEATFDDEPFDAQKVLAGEWFPGPYGPDDQRGTFNEVTPEKTASALARLDLSRPVKTYNLSEMLHNDFPAHGDRRYHSTHQVDGYSPPERFEGIVATRERLGDTLIVTMEERVLCTYNMGTKINGLHHVGVGGVFYNGFRLDDIVETWGTTKLGMETQGPIVTRGVLIDVVGYKVAQGLTDDYEVLSNGRPMLREAYRITVEDIEEVLAWEGVTDPIGPGDVVLFRTGWRELIDLDPERYLNYRQPGPFLRECHYLAARRPAIIGIDIWFFGAAMDDSMVTMMCHQLLPTKYGVRVGEAVPSDDLAEDRVYDFVFCFNPNNAKGAVSANTPPIALGQPAV